MRTWVEYMAFRLCLGLLGVLPLPVALRVGEAGALLALALGRRHRRIASLNLAIAFPAASQRERRRILRRSYLNLGRMAAEVAHLGRLTPEAVDKRITIVNRAAWKRELDRPRTSGGFILTAHFGSWELLAYAHGLLGYPVHVVYRRLRNPLVDRYMISLRARAGTKMITKGSGARAIVRALEEKQILVLLIDRNRTRGQGVFVDFFGLPACTTTGLARLAARPGVRVVPAFLVREGRSGRHRLEWGPDVELERTGDREADMRANTERFTKVIEEAIRRHPDHWFWVHRRWKTRPMGEPRFY